MKTGHIKKRPNDALRFFVIVIDSNVQTRSQVLESNRITEIGGERSMKGMSLVVSVGETDRRCQRKALMRTWPSLAVSTVTWHINNQSNKITAMAAKQWPGGTIKR